MKKFLIFLTVILLLTSCDKKKTSSGDDNKFEGITKILSSKDLDRDSVFSIMNSAIDYYKGKNDYKKITSIYEIILENNRFKDSFIDSAYVFALKMKSMKNDSIAVRMLSLIINDKPNFDMNENYSYIVNYYKNSQNELYATKIIKEILPSIKSKKIKTDLYKDIIDIYEDLSIHSLAFQYCERAIADIGEDPDILYRYGAVSYEIAQAKYETKNYAAALFYANKTISAGLPESLQDDAYLLKGEIYFYENMFGKAKVAFNKVLELNPYRQGNTVKIAKKYINEIEDKEF